MDWSSCIQIPDLWHEMMIENADVLGMALWTEDTLILELNFACRCKKLCCIWSRKNRMLV